MDTTTDAQAAGRDLTTTPAAVVAAEFVAARWLFLALLALAPWAWGGTPFWASLALHSLLGLVLVLQAAGCARRRVRPQLPPLLLGSALFLAAQVLGLAVWRCLLGGDPPGKAECATVAWAALRGFLLLGAITFAAELGRDPRWRKRLLQTVGLTCASVAAWGLAQQWMGAPGIFWQTDETAPTFFATFDYHANAGAFLNLGWPVTAGLLLAAGYQPGALRQRAFWLAGLAVTVAAVFVNTSRGAHFVAALLLVAWAAALIRQLWRNGWPQTHPASLLVALALGAVLVVGIATAIGIDRTVQRWQRSARDFTADNSRYQATRACLRIAPEAGLLGFGPGTFPAVFAHYQPHLPDAPSGEWLFAHNDYLQTVLEYGWLGALGWLIVLAGGSFHALRAPRPRRRDGPLVTGVVLALLGVAIHAAGDYPLQVASIQFHVAALAGCLWSLGNPGARNRQVL